MAIILKVVLKKLKRMDYRVRHIVARFGVTISLKTKDRLILETIILPYFKTPGVKNILFVGCDWYTKKCEELFSDKEYCTIDSDVIKSKYGSSNRHIVDSLRNLTLYFNEGYFDLIICNGVFGWGLNERYEVEQSFYSCYNCLRKGGIFVIGWNDVEEHRPFPLSESKALLNFKPYIFPPLSTNRFLGDDVDRHVFEFYEKC